MGNEICISHKNINPKKEGAMKDTGSLHKKMQEEIDCHSGTDYLTELSKLKNEPNLQEAALKWLALAILHGINSNAEKISLKKSEDGGIKITAKYRDGVLPNPGTEVANNVFETIRGITHIEAEKGKIQLSVGVRDSSVDMGIKLKKEDGEESLVLKFP
jgi:hypothetical protein